MTKYVDALGNEVEPYHGAVWDNWASVDWIANPSVRTERVDLPCDLAGITCGDCSPNACGELAFEV